MSRTKENTTMMTYTTYQRLDDIPRDCLLGSGTVDHPQPPALVPAAEWEVAAVLVAHPHGPRVPVYGRRADTVRS